jgi:hypothetical protein
MQTLIREFLVKPNVSWNTKRGTLNARANGPNDGKPRVETVKNLGREKTRETWLKVTVGRALIQMMFPTDWIVAGKGIRTMIVRVDLTVVRSV